jgi:prepilin-type N-terminal cleavage/methylation domain-containing protein
MFRCHQPGYCFLAVGQGYALPADQPKTSRVGGHGRSRRWGSRRGLSLLEVVLALSILGIATGILSSILFQAADTGLKSRRITQAELICEAKMAEAISGSLPLQVISWTPASTVDGTNWYYSMELLPAQMPSMIGIGISVTDDLGMSESPRPLARLVQWMIDPSLGLDVKPVPEATATEATGASTSGAAGGGL